MDEFDKKYGIIDAKTPRNIVIPSIYKKSFAYICLRERFPAILTQIVDNLNNEKAELTHKHGDNVQNEMKIVTENILKLKEQLETDQKLELFTGNEPDKDTYNKFISALKPEECTFYKTCWLYAECYIYRKVRSFFEAQTLLHDHDHFAKQKENSLICYSNSLEALVKSSRNDKPADGEFFRKLLKFNLWGNRADLSITMGKEIDLAGNQFDMLRKLEDHVIVDQSELIWNCISEPCCDQRIIDFIFDNSGYELFTDFIIADYIIDKKLACKVRFHAKAIPWYISDVNARDFHWSLDYLSNHQSQTLSEIGKKWLNFVKQGRFELCPLEYFWTSPYEFYRMKEMNECLYNKLSEAHLVIFKGDLNYRKLIGDFTWDPTENFKICLRGFLPTNVCTLRTLKADVICGLKPGVAESLDKTTPNWMISGEFGVLQFASKQ